MAKEELKVVSTEPVDLDDKETSKANDFAEPVSETKEKDDNKEAVTEKQAPKDTAPDKDTDKKETVAEDKPVVPAKDEVSDVDIDAPPPPPPRPVSPVSQLKQTLREAFPSIEEKLITAVIIASQGNLDPAFNALLYISDPSFEPEVTIPEAAPPVPTKPKATTLTDDELLARQLQKEFEKEDRRRRQKQRRQQQPESDESPDEFEQLKESFTQGIEEARSTLNGWVSGLLKKLGGDDQKQQSPKLFGALGGSSFKNPTRKNNRFDEDPEILSNDFHNNIKLSNNDEQKPPLPQRKDEKWQPLNPDRPINSDAFLVTDSEDEDKDKK